MSTPAKLLTYNDGSTNGMPVQVESAIRDSTGKVINTTYATKDEVGGVQIEGENVTFSLQSTPDYPEYPYRGIVENSTITSDTYATVTFSGEQSTSGNFAPFCKTVDGYLYLYANVGGTFQIPTINLGGGETTTVTVDAVPTDGSSNPVSSNGVYDAINQTHIVLSGLQNVAFTTASGDATYPYMADIQDERITADTFATVAFASAEASSGNFAPYCACDTGHLYLYSKISTTVNIPSIDLGAPTIGGMTTISNTPTDGDFNPISSDGVYEAVRKGLITAVASDVVVATAAATDYSVPLTTDSTHTNGMLSVSGSVFTILKSGLVRFTIHGQLTTSTATRIGYSVYLNGVWTQASVTQYCIQWSRFTGSEALYLDAGTTLELKVRGSTNGDTIGGINISVSVENI